MHTTPAVTPYERQKIILGIVDDHQIVIDGLKSLLHGHDQFEVVIECTQPLEMISLIEKKSIDILLTDIMMPGLNGAELSKQVHQQFPQIKNTGT
ncbi:MAG: response regulator [Chitinophagaceae bacterium]|nr:response regulator [Chitinophagaceae bacterium]